VAGVIGGYTPGDEMERLSTHAYGAVFAQVAVDERLGLVRVRRVLGVYDAGRIINPELAHSQAIGGLVGGIGMALLEHTLTDPGDGRPGRQRHHDRQGRVGRGTARPSRTKQGHRRGDRVAALLSTRALLQG
jgi:CO/xanthine dehydrogenase Mo-binding subunit